MSEFRKVLVIRPYADGCDNLAGIKVSNITIIVFRIDVILFKIHNVLMPFRDIIITEF